MLEIEQIVQFLHENKELFRREFQVSKIGVFGSFARRQANEKSDIDILIEFDHNNDLFDTKLKIKEILEKRFHRSIDICREKYLKPYIKDQILKETIYVG
ncbi:MAG: hypothetical protein A2Y33_03465 [Spirochaetes bacterium GWF1_51_8]|nr:MAG: hypothetical protein A2Y33_03465 [Spirochaetes bacterium GWF1_51_8]